MSAPAKLGPDFAHALAEKDTSRLRDLLHAQIEFRALTPRRNWEANDPDAVLEIVFGSWFDESDDIRTLEKLESDEFADRQRVGYRFAVTNPDGDFIVEQQAYLAERDGRIGWMRIVCSGFREVP